MDNLKNQILNSIDENLVSDQSKIIKAKYLNKKSVNKGKWIAFGSVLSAIMCSAIVIPLIRNAQTLENIANSIPTTISNQVNDISFSIGSLTGILESGQVSNSSKRAIGNKYGNEWNNGPSDNTNYLTSVKSMYTLVTPYLSTIDGLLNGSEFEYKVEPSGNETYPYRLGNFIFNIVEDKEQEGEIIEEEEDPTEDDDLLNENKRNNKEPGGDPWGEDPWGEDDYEIDFTFIEEFYRIEGLLEVEELTYPVSGEQITFGCTFDSDSTLYSELYLNVKKDETHEVTVYKSTYSSEFSNSFWDQDYGINYSEESYAYIESELFNKEWHGHEYQERKVTNAIQISSSSSETSINDEVVKAKENVYLGLESSYVDEEENENTIIADLSFRLPRNDNGDHHGIPFYHLLDEENEEEPNEEEENSAEPVVAFRADYDLQVIKNTPYEQSTSFGHGEYGHDNGHVPDYWDYLFGPSKNYTSVFGSFYVYKDAEGNFLEPDFENEGRHQVTSNGGYFWDWYDSWDW